MSQINANFQEMISNNNNQLHQSTGLDNVSGGSTIITSETLQGFSMANQFAICANSGGGPLLLSCLTPMLLPTLSGTSKGTFDGNQQQQTVQIQLASPFNGQQSLQSLGLSYINLSSLTNSGNTFPLQITLNNNNNSNNNNNHNQITIPTATLNSLSQELQLAQNYQISSQVKFESDMNISAVQQQQQQQPQQLTVVNRVQDLTDIDDKIKRKPRRRIPNKSISKTLAVMNGDSEQGQSATTQERLLDHKGRPFIYNCPNCPKKFTLNSRLTAHLRCHTGIRPYTCGQCGFSFTQKSYLIRHAAVHTEERPFTCERCLKTYKHYGSLANHRKLHRKEDKNGGGGGDIIESELPHHQKQAICDLAATTTATNIIDNHHNILQLHSSSDWSAVSDNINNTTTTYHIITNNNNNNSDNHSTYYTDSSSSSNNNNNNILSGAVGPVAFPDHHQHQQQHASNASLSQPKLVSYCASSKNNDNILYTHVEMAPDIPQSSSAPSQTYSSTANIIQ